MRAAAPRDPRRVVVALGGRLLRPPPDALDLGTWPRALSPTLSPLADLVDAGFRLVLALASPGWEEALGAGDPGSPGAFGLRLAAAHGALGHAVQQTLGNHLRTRGVDVDVVPVVTRVLVAADDPALACPTRPVGPSYAVGRARQLARAHGWTLAEAPGRGHCRLLPAPRPLGVVETEAVRRLVEAGLVPLAGSGVPVVETPGGHVAVDAFVEPDLAAERLATDLGADRLVFLVDVEQLQVGHGTPRAIGIERLTVREASALLEAGEFPAVTAGVKVEAAVRFVSGGGRAAIVVSPGRLRDALEGRAGTRIVA